MKLSPDTDLSRDKMSSRDIRSSRDKTLSGDIKLSRDKLHHPWINNYLEKQKLKFKFNKASYQRTKEKIYTKTEFPYKNCSPEIKVKTIKNSISNI